MTHQRTRVDVFVNPRSGQAAPLKQLSDLLERRFPSSDWKCKIHDIEKAKEDDVAKSVRKAVKKGASLVVAAGGDGVVGKVANGLVHTDVPLGILPLGTGNDLARALHVPVELERAVDLLAGPHDLAVIDALRVGDRYCFSNVSVGISAEMMAGTRSKEKRRFGPIAYVWTLLNNSAVLRLHPYSLTIDGQSTQLRASEILVSNATVLQQPTDIFGPVETLRDGQAEVYVVSAGSTREYAELLWGMLRSGGGEPDRLHHWEAHKRIEIDTPGAPALVQGDGSVIGETPVEIRLVPRVLSVIMPVRASDGVDGRAAMAMGSPSREPAEALQA